MWKSHVLSLPGCGVRSRTKVLPPRVVGHGPVRWSIASSKGECRFFDYIEVDRLVWSLRREGRYGTHCLFTVP